MSFKRLIWHLALLYAIIMKHNKAKKEKDKKSKKSKSPAIDWRNELSKLYINDPNSSTTCQVAFLAEKNTSCSNHVRQFHELSQQQTTVDDYLVMSLHWPELLARFENKPPQSSETGLILDIYTQAQEEIGAILAKNGEPPGEIMAKLIKIEIILRTNRILQLEEAPKYLYFVLNGFYNSYLLQELATIEIPICSIIEIGREDNNYEVFYDPAVPSSAQEIFGEEQQRNQSEKILETVQEIGISESDKHLRVLHEFWPKIYEILEQSAFENTIHLKHDGLSCIYWGVVELLLKMPKLKQQHQTYLKNLCVFNITPVIIKLETRQMQTYIKMMKQVPDECFTVATLLHCLLEEVSINIRDPLPTENIPVYTPLVKKHQHKVHELNRLEIVSKACNNVAEDLFQVHSNAYAKCLPVLLWKNHPYFNAESFVTNHFPILKIWRDNHAQSLSTEELKKLIHRLSYVILNCKQQDRGNIVNSHANLNQFVRLPENAAKITVHNIPLPVHSAMFAPPGPQSREIPYIRYIDTPNVYEAVNLHTFHWYEELAKLVMLQKLTTASFAYVCTDYQFCPITDSILFRFHNDLDEFGLNTRFWTQSLRTPLCLRDFYKYAKEEDILKLKKREAYNVGEGPKKLIGTTTIFQSMDGVQVTVDQTSFINEAKNLSLKISSNHHDCVFHARKCFKNGSLSFHFNHSNETIFTFTKPDVWAELPRLVTQKQSTMLTGREGLSAASIYRKKPSIYWFSEACKPTKVTSSCLPPSQVSNKILIEWIKYMEDTNVIKNNASKSTCICSSPTKLEDLAEEIIKLEDKQVYQNPLEMGQTIFEPNCLKQRIALIKKIATAIAKHSPKYSIISSRLHVHNYIKRCKPYLILHFKTYKLKVPFYNPLGIKTKRLIQIEKTFNLRETNSQQDFHSLKYKFKAMLPSGLQLWNSPGLGGNSFYISQKYSPNCPLGRRLKHEATRRFLRNGSLVISNFDGTTEVLSMHEDATKLDMPYASKKTKIKTYYCSKNQEKLTGEPCCKRSNTPLHFCRKSKPPMLKKQWRLQKHLVNGPDSRFFAWRRTSSRFGKQGKVLRIQKIKETTLEEYSTLDPDGNSVNFKKITEHGKASARRINPHIDWWENPYPKSVSLKNNGDLLKKFPDGTRITTFTYISPINVKLEDDTDPQEEFSEDVSCHSSADDDARFYQSYLDITTGALNSSEEISAPTEHNRDSSQDELLAEEPAFNIWPPGTSSELFSTILQYTMSTARTSDPWVNVCIGYRFQHPSYATVEYTSSGNTDEGFVKITLPDDIVIIINEAEEYTINFDEYVRAGVTTEEISFAAQLCLKCKQECMTKINLGPLYAEETPPENNQSLLITLDSFQKLFMVDYNGRCSRNAHYIAGRVNQVECQMHDQHEPQKLLVLYRDLSGVKLWDTKLLHQRFLLQEDHDMKIDDEQNLLEFKTDVAHPYSKLIQIPYKQRRHEFAYSTFRQIRSFAFVEDIKVIYPLVVETFLQTKGDPDYDMLSYVSAIMALSKELEKKRSDPKIVPKANKSKSDGELQTEYEKCLNIHSNQPKKLEATICECKPGKKAKQSEESSYIVVEHLKHIEKHQTEVALRSLLREFVPHLPLREFNLCSRVPNLEDYARNIPESAPHSDHIIPSKEDRSAVSITIRNNETVPADSIKLLRTSPTPDASSNIFPMKEPSITMLFMKDNSLHRTSVNPIIKKSSETTANDLKESSEALKKIAIKFEENSEPKHPHGWKDGLKTSKTILKKASSHGLMALNEQTDGTVKGYVSQDLGKKRSNSTWVSGRRISIKEGCTVMSVHNYKSTSKLDVSVQHSTSNGTATNSAGN